MNWKDFFKLSVMKDGPQGSRPYFTSELQVPDSFSIEDLNLSAFDHLDLSSEERQRLTLGLRKILLSHHYFQSMEFQRIFLNFYDRLVSEKHQQLNFSTTGGGIHLFLAALKVEDPALKGKLITCTSREPLLSVSKFSWVHNENIQFFYHPIGKNFFGHLPGLWHQSGQIKHIHSNVA